MAGDGYVKRGGEAVGGEKEKISQRISQQMIQKRKDIETNARNQLKEEIKNKNNFVNKCKIKIVFIFKH